MLKLSALLVREGLLPGLKPILPHPQPVQLATRILLCLSAVETPLVPVPPLAKGLLPAGGCPPTNVMWTVK